MIPGTYPAAARKRWTVTLIRSDAFSESFRVYAWSFYEAEVRAVERCFGKGAFFYAYAEVSLLSDGRRGQILGPKRKGVSAVYADRVTVKTAPGW